MSQEIVGEVTVRSSKPDRPVVLGAEAADRGGLGPLGPNFLAGPVTIVMSGDGREIVLGASTAAAARIHLDGATGNVTVRDHNGQPVLRFESRFALLDIGGIGNEGDIRVRNASDAVTIHLDGNTGDITLANADVAEDFDVADPQAVDPGTVLVLGDDGLLRPSASRCDPRVVGVVAGAEGYRPAVVLDRRAPGPIARAAVSIMGKVAVKAVAEDGAIRVGDLLATSSETGRAMAVPAGRPPVGAVIGKALSPLARGSGMVDMLVGLR